MKPKIKITLDAECIAKLQRGEVELVEHETAILEFHWKGTIGRPNPSARGTGAYIE